MSDLVGRLKWAAELVGRILGDEVDQYGSVSYRTTLESIVAPVRVPGLAEVIVAWDHKVWGWDQMGDTKAEMSGAFRNLMEGAILEYLTDLTPSKLSALTPAAIRRRLQQKMAPLARHLSRGESPFSGVKQRVNLWTLNKVHGQTIAEIITSLESDKSRITKGESPERWVKQQIREASRMLGAEVARGVPEKGQWLSSGKCSTKS